MPDLRILLLRPLLDLLSHHVAAIWSSIRHLQTIAVQCSSFNVNPLSFMVRNRHRRQRGIWCLLWPCLRDKFPCTPLSNTFNVSLFRHLRYVSICWFRSRSWPMSKFCRQVVEIRSWLPLRNVLDDNRQSHPELDRSSTFHETILSLEMIDHSRQSVLSTWSFQSVKFRVIKCREALKECLRTSSRIYATSFPVLLHRSEKFDLLSTLLHGVQVIKCYGLPRTLRTFPGPILHKFPLLLRRHFADWRK